jgi:hypothetical protein
LDELLGDWLKIFRELTCGTPLGLGEVFWHVPTPPRSVEVSIYVPEIDAELWSA